MNYLIFGILILLIQVCIGYIFLKMLDNNIKKCLKSIKEASDKEFKAFAEDLEAAIETARLEIMNMESPDILNDLGEYEDELAEMSDEEYDNVVSEKKKLLN